MGRIVMVVRASKGGAFGHVMRLSSALIEQGHSVAIAGPHGDRVEAMGADAIDLSIGREISMLDDLQAVRQLISETRRFGADLVHAHGSKAGVVGRLARIGNPRVPVVFSPHNFAFENYFASRSRQAFYRLIEHAMVPFTSRFLCVCEAEGKAAARIAPARRIRVVHNGIEGFPSISRDPELQKLCERGPVIASVTELHPRKGIGTLVDAMPRVLDAHPGATLLIAGDGPSRDQITSQIGRLGLGESIVLLGNVEDVTTVYGVADAFVLSAWSEAFPYAILEAMSVGLPIVATDVGGVGEAIEDGVTGRLVPARDPVALADALSGTLTDRNQASALGDMARQRWGERFTFESMLEGTLSVYAELGLG